MIVILDSNYPNLYDFDKNAVSYNEDKNEFLLNICQPLFEYFGITSFEYFHFYKNNTCIYLSTNLNWHNYFIKNYIRTSFIRDHIQKVFNENRVYHQWDTGFTPKETDHAKFISDRRKFGIWYDFTIYEHYGESIEAWSFSTTEENYELINRYINETNQLRWFILYFYQKGSKIIGPSSLKIPQIKGSLFSEDILSENSCSKIEQPLTKIIHVTKFRWNMSDKSIFLTPREVETMHHRCNGMTAKEAAKKMGNKDRTVETIQYNVKNKAGFEDTAKLRKKFRESNLGKLPFGDEK